MENNLENTGILELSQILFKDFPDIVKVKDLKIMLPKTGKNKIYNLLKSKEIFSIKIGRDYYIPKVSIIKYFTGKN